MSRGQTLLETTIALGVLLVAIGAITIAFRETSVNEHPADLHLIAYSELSDAATELVAATAYDPQALGNVSAAGWTVTPPVPPSPAPTGAAGPVALTSQVAPYGDSRVVQLHGAVGAQSVDATVSLRFAAPPPGAIVVAPSPTPSP